MSLPHTFFIGRGGGGSLYDFANHTFSPAGAFGQLGPTLTMAKAAYDPVTLYNDNSGAAGANTAWDLDAELFSMPQQGLQLWTVPETATYNFDLRGAYGGPAMWNATRSPGSPIRIYNAEIELEQGQKLLIVIGQRGGEGNNGTGSASGGGGGGTYVCKYGNGADADGTLANAITPLLVAAGGNGEPYSGWYVDGPDGRPSSVNSSGVSTYTPGGAPWWQNIMYGRGAFGGGFNVDWGLMKDFFSYFPTAETLVTTGGHLYRTGFSLLNSSRGVTSGDDSWYQLLSSESSRGGLASGQTVSQSNAKTLSGSDWGFGGFGGGGGTLYEGGGGGGYHGGAPVHTNQTSSVYAYGATSYVSSSINSGSVESVFTGGATRKNNGYQNTFPHHTLSGLCTITKI